MQRRQRRLRHLLPTGLPRVKVTRTPPMQDTALIDASNHATTLDLYQLSALVERLMTDPRRIVAIRKDLHLGQVVKFYDSRRDAMREGRIVEMRDTQLTLHDT